MSVCGVAGVGVSLVGVSLNPMCCPVDIGPERPVECQDAECRPDWSEQGLPVLKR